MMETIKIELVHTAADEHCLTAFDSDDNPICSLVDSGDGFYVTDGVDGERVASIGAVECDRDESRWFESVHRALYANSDAIDEML